MVERGDGELWMLDVFEANGRIGSWWLGLGWACERELVQRWGLGLVDIRHELDERSGQRPRAPLAWNVYR